METIGPYTVREELGRGAMGVVYRAFDPRVGRDVAIKVLGALGGSVDLERFRREAEAAARIRHPNVVAVHELGRDARGPYLVMDWVEGESLAERLKRQGPFTGEEVVRLGIQLAGALSALHEAGILHRDLKPENVLLGVDGRARLTDFGLVRLGDAQRLTATGAALGTPAYMSPEQASGARDAIDARSDVYGLGATLYALLVAQPPFGGSSALVIMSRVASEPVTPPSKLVPVGRALEAIVLRCLEKDPAARYPDAAALEEALVSNSEGPPPSRLMLGLGMLAVAAVTLLAVGVASQGSPSPPEPAEASAADVSSSPPKPAAAPGDDLEASSLGVLVERGQEALRRGDLSQARGLFERGLALAPTSEAVLRGLARIRYEWEDPAGAIALLDRLEGDSSSDLEAERALYLAVSGRGLEAIEVAKRAIAADPSGARALAALARVREVLGDFEQALAAAQEALHHDPENVEALVTRSRIRGLYGEQDRAKVLADRAIQLEPDNSEARVALAVAVFKLGRHEEAIDALRAILDRFPRHARARYLLGFAYLVLRKPGRALEHFDRALELAPGYPPAEQEKAKALFELGRTAEALAALEALAAVNPWRHEGHRALAEVRAKSGDAQGYVAAMTRAIETAARERSSDFFGRGAVLRALGRVEEAADDFAQAVEISPERADAQFAAGAVLHQLGRYAEAKRFLTARIQIAQPPPPFEALYMLAEVCSRDQEYTEALALLKVALPLARSDGQRRDVHYQQAWAHDALRHWRAALGEFRAAIRLDPAYSGVRRARLRIRELRSKLKR